MIYLDLRVFSTFHTYSLTSLEPNLTAVVWRAKKKLEQWRWSPLNFFSGSQGITIFFNGSRGIPPEKMSGHFPNLGAGLAFRAPRWRASSVAFSKSRRWARVSRTVVGEPPTWTRVRVHPTVTTCSVRLSASANRRCAQTWKQTGP